MIRRIGAVLIVGVLLSATGCSMPDALFGLFGTHYSSANDRDDRYNDYKTEVDRWSGYHAESGD